MAKLQVTKIPDGNLLENLEDGKIVDSTEWNNVMSTIKSAINTNADILHNSGVSAVQIVVSPNTQYPNTKTWASTGNYYSVELASTDYKIQGPKNIKTYLIQTIQSNGSPGNILEEVQNNIKYQSNSITIISKSNSPMLVIIQGVGV